MLTRMGRTGEAVKRINSHGVAEHSAEGLQRLQDLLPTLKEPVPPLPAELDQFRTSESEVRKFLFNNCTGSWKSLDPFGWSSALLHLVRVNPNTASEGPSFFDGVVKLVVALANCEVCDLAALVQTTGVLFAFNKVEPAEQEARKQRGLLPKERGINNGAFFLKCAFAISQLSPQAKKARKDLEPQQQGVGATRGMELLSHSASSHWASGEFAILMKDVINGFPELKRAALFRKVEQRCPSHLPLFHKYYGKRAGNFYLIGDTLRVAWNEEGTRIGCKFGSWGFGITIQDLYEEVQRILDSSSVLPDGSPDHSFIKAATDDAVVLIRADPDKRDALFERVTLVNGVMKKEAELIGLQYPSVPDTAKSVLLLPRGWEPPAEGAVPSNLAVVSDMDPDFTRQGIVIAGAPIGSADFQRHFAAEKFASYMKVFSSLPDLNAQIASNLLRNSICLAPAYLTQLCPPSITNDFCEAFDAKAFETLIRCIGGTELSMCAEGIQRAFERFLTPSSLGGAGFRSCARNNNAAWAASVAACAALGDPNFDYGRQFLVSEALLVQAKLVQQLGSLDAASELLDVSDSSSLATSDFYSEPRANLQKFLSLTIATRHLKDFIQSDSLHITDSERQRFAEDGPAFAELFSADLANTNTRSSSASFSINARRFLILPAKKTKIGEVVTLNCGCDQQMCGKTDGICPGKSLDPFGKHSTQCNHGTGSLNASLLEKRLDKCAREAGTKHPSQQPSTYQLTGGVFTPDELRFCFAGKQTESQAASRLQKALNLLNALSIQGEERSAAVIEAKQAIPGVQCDPSQKNKNPNNGIIHFDLLFPALDSNVMLIVDHARVHDACNTYAPAMLNAARKQRKGELAVDFEDSSAFRNRRTQKNTKYKHLMELITRLALDHRLDFQPKFLFPLITPNGRINRDMALLQNFLVETHKVSLEREGPRADGKTTKELTLKFRKYLKTSIFFSVLEGTAMEMHNQGTTGICKPW